MDTVSTLASIAANLATVVIALRVIARRWR
jgi:hypothetical protein